MVNGDGVSRKGIYIMEGKLVKTECLKLDCVGHQEHYEVSAWELVSRLGAVRNWFAGGRTSLTLPQLVPQYFLSEASLSH